MLDVRRPVSAVAPQSLVQVHTPVSHTIIQSFFAKHTYIIYSTPYSISPIILVIKLHCRWALEQDLNADTHGTSRLPLNSHSLTPVHYPERMVLHYPFLIMA